MAPPMDPPKTASDPVKPVTDKSISGSEKSTIATDKPHLLGLRDTPSGLETGVRAAQQQSGTVTEAVKKVPQIVKEAVHNAPSPSKVLNEKLGTTIGSKGYFNSALQFAKMNSFAWGGAAAVGILAYMLSGSFKAKPQPKIETKTEVIKERTA